MARWRRAGTWGWAAWGDNEEEGDQYGEWEAMVGLVRWWVGPCGSLESDGRIVGESFIFFSSLIASDPDLTGFTSRF